MRMKDGGHRVLSDIPLPPLVWAERGFRLATTGASFLAIRNPDHFLPISLGSMIQGKFAPIMI